MTSKTEQTRVYHQPGYRSQCFPPRPDLPKPDPPNNDEAQEDERPGPAVLFGPDDRYVAAVEGAVLTVRAFDEIGADDARPISEARLKLTPEKFYAGGRQSPLKLYTLDGNGRLLLINFADPNGGLAREPEQRPLAKDLDTPIWGLVVLRRKLILQTGEAGARTLYALSRRTGLLSELGDLALDRDLSALDPDRNDILVGRVYGEARLVLVGANAVGPGPEVHDFGVPRVTAAAMVGGTHLILAQKGGHVRKVDLRAAVPQVAATAVEPWERLCYLLRTLLKRCGCECECKRPGGGTGRPGDDESCDDRHRANLGFTPYRLHRVGAHMVAAAAGGTRMAVMDARLNVVDERRLDRHGTIVLTGQTHSQNMLVHWPRKRRLEAFKLADYVAGLQPLLPADFIPVPLPLPKTVTYWGREDPAAVPNPTIKVCLFPVIDPGQTYDDATMAKLIDQIDAKSFDRINDYYDECSFGETDYQFTTFGQDIGGARKPLLLPRAVASYWYEGYRGGGLKAVMPADWAVPVAFDGDEALRIQANPRAGSVNNYDIPFAALWTSRDMGNFPVNVTFAGGETLDLDVETQDGTAHALTLTFGAVNETLNQGDDASPFLAALGTHVTQAIRNAEATLPGSPVLIQDVVFRRTRTSTDATQFGWLQAQFRIQPLPPASATQKGRLSIQAGGAAAASDIGLSTAADRSGVMTSENAVREFFSECLRAGQVDADEGIGGEAAYFNTSVSTDFDAAAQEVTVGISFTSDFGGNEAMMEVVSSSNLSGTGWDTAKPDPGSKSDPNNSKTLRDSIDLADDAFTAACQHIHDSGAWNRPIVQAMFADFDVMMITHIGAPHPGIPAVDAWSCDEPADFSSKRMYKRTYFARDLTPPAGEVPVQMGTDAITGQNFTYLNSANLNDETGVMAHELGHALGLPDLYSANGYRDDVKYVDPFAMMAGGNDNFHHFCGWSKWSVDWIADDPDPDENRTIFVDLPSPTGTLARDAWLVPVEYWDNAMRTDVRAEVGGTVEIGQMMKLNLGSDGGVTAFLELRARGSNFSQLLTPQPTVIATNGLDPESDREWAVNGLYRRSVHLLNNGNELMAIGDTWDFASAPEFPVKGTVAEIMETRTVRGAIPVWRVRVTREQAEYIDLHFQDHVPAWKSPDIWVDWLGDNADPNVPREYPIGSPTDQGETVRFPSSGTEKHYVVARVHNAGNVAAEEVKVRWFVCDPPGAGDDGRWDNRGTKTIPLVGAGDNKLAVFDWDVDTGTNEHQCMRMEIIDWSIPDGVDPATGDTVALASDDVKLQNNNAQQNVFDFEALTGSPYDPFQFLMQVHNDRNRIETAALVPRGLPHGAKLTISPREWRIPPGQARTFNCTLELNNNVIRPGCDNDSGFLLTAWRRGGEADTNWGSCFYHIRPRYKTRIELVRGHWFHGRVRLHGLMQPVTDTPLNLTEDLPLIARIRMQIDGDGGPVVWKAAQIAADGTFSLDVTENRGKTMIAQAWFDRTDRLGSSVSNEWPLRQSFLE